MLYIGLFLRVITSQIQSNSGNNFHKINFFMHFFNNFYILTLGKKFMATVNISLSLISFYQLYKNTLSVNSCVFNSYFLNFHVVSKNK